MTWYHLVVFIHVISAMIWVGGIAFLGIIAIPSVRRLQPETRSQLVGELGLRFRNIGYTLLAVLIATGIIQSIANGASISNVLDGSFFDTRFGSALANKLIYFALMIGVSITHDFYIGPKSVKLAQAGQNVDHLRKAASWLARLTAIFALLVVLYAILLSR